MPRTLIDMLVLCRKQFETYKGYHIEKGTSDSLVKAAANQQMIEQIDRTIKQYEESKDRLEPLTDPGDPTDTTYFR